MKRILKQNLQIATREINALIESDSDDNVIRYFGTVRFNEFQRTICFLQEADKHFRYLALELCIASLSDYIENAVN